MPNLEILAQHSGDRLAKAKEQYLGKTFSSNNFGDFIVVDYVNSNRVKIKFVNTKYEMFARIGDILNGQVKDKSCKTVYGVGVVGNKYKTRDDDKKIYSLWCDMLRRCFSDAFKIKYKTYKDCTCSENFKSYEYFYEWCNKQIGFNEHTFEIDKDLLVKGNKLYSENTCVFLPKEINYVLVKCNSARGEYPIGVCFHKQRNKFLSNIRLNNGNKNYLGLFDTPEKAFQAYKIAKESYLKELAEKYKSQIDPRAYKALMNYQVEITD